MLVAFPLFNIYILPHTFFHTYTPKYRYAYAKLFHNFISFYQVNKSSKLTVINWVWNLYELSLCINILKH